MSEFIYLLLFCFPFCFVVVVVFFYVDSQRINFMPFCFYEQLPVQKVGCSENKFDYIR